MMVLAFLTRLADSELVQIVTPEHVHIVTPVGNEPDMKNIKREAPKNHTMDSYLAALSESQGAASRYDPPEPTNGYKNSPPHHDGYEHYEEEDSSYGPPQGYQPSKPDHGEASSYGPPHGYQPSKPDHGEVSSYGPPQGYQPSKPSYHTPSIPYGPPSPMTYLPPSNPMQPTPFYGIPFAASHSMVMSALQNLMPKGIDLEMVFKLLLKFVLFKMIVKFIAVTCLLLAYPLFQSKNKEDDAMDEDEEKRRQFEVINDLTTLVWDSVFKNNQTHNRDEDQLVEKVAGVIDDKMTAPR